LSKLDVVILAGAPAGSELSPDAPELNKAMLNLGSKTMLQWIVDALKGASSTGRIVAVGDVRAEGLDKVVEPAGNLIDNVKLGINTADSEPVLVVCSDIPLLTPEAIDDFVARAPKDAGLVYPIIRREACSKHPELKRTYLKTADGVFTGGNVMLLSRDFVDRNWKTIQGAYEARKKPVELAKMIGIGVLLRVILAQAIPNVLKVAYLERTISRMLGGKVAAECSEYPEIGEDVDKASDLEAVRKILCIDT
jgi:GTP:adenosylcobinamide-phosphate guanylyltransferase